VFSSSNAPLGEGAYPAREDKPIAPLSPYGASKAVGEAYCSAFHGAYGMHAVAVRFSNAYGPRSAHKGNVIPLFIRRLRAGEELTVYGDGEQTRDFVFCEDLADGLIRAAEADGAGGEIFQLASGVETSLNRLLELLGEVSGTEPRVRREPPRAGEILRNYSSVDKARDRLGYRPSVALAEGLQRTWDWFASAHG
jgi:UDP-glucose 4-epimerase